MEEFETNIREELRVLLNAERELLIRPNGEGSEEQLELRKRINVLQLEYQKFLRERGGIEWR